ncbi:unnamed protein product [Closterium sp. Naga37s-1]|nr:unnamed protein product [Closterium sp. Naga37s-1]CAI5503866.1 unnamed protein product [Closterium sp. Naga37s-1]
MVADGGALINLANNFFFGDAVLFAAGCKVCPTEVNEPNNLDLWNISKWMVGGKCNDALVNNSVMGAGSEVRVSLSGNCLTLSPNAGCASHAIQRSKAACKALCSITANGPCDGHGECVQPDPASPSKFTCLCDAGYSVVDSGNGSTCAIVYSNTTTGNTCFIHSFLQVCLFLSYSRASSLQHCLFLQQCLFLAALPHTCILPQCPCPCPCITHLLTSAPTLPVKPPVSLTSHSVAVSSLSTGAIHASFHHISPSSACMDALQAMKLVEAYELEELRDGKMLAASEEAIVEFADLALDCIKSPGTRRPTMKDVAYRLSALINKHCPDKEDEWESLVKEESDSNEGITSRDISAASLGDSGRESGRSYGSQSGVSLFMRIGSIGDGPKSWLQQLKPNKGR